MLRAGFCLWTIDYGLWTLCEMRSPKSKSTGLRLVEFPYLKDAQGRYAPIVYLQVWTGNRWLYLQAYVDSGA